MKFEESNLILNKDFEGLSREDIILKQAKHFEFIQSEVERIKLQIEQSTQYDKTKLYAERKILSEKLLNAQNRLSVARNGGDFYSFADKKGRNYDVIPDFTHLNSDDILFDENTISENPKPEYIPHLDKDAMRIKSYVIDAIRVSADLYLCAVRQHDEKNGGEYFLINLDKLVLTGQYYEVLRKGELVQDAIDKTERNEKHWDSLPESRRESFLMQRGIYHSLPAKIKKEISQEDYEALGWQERESIYKFYKRYSPKRTKKSIEYDSMPSSQHDMYERFVNPEAVKKEGRYGNPLVFEYWKNYLKILELKLNDLEIQRKDLSESYSKAIETSFGEANSNASLREEYGIYVKNQDGTEIDEENIKQIEDAWKEIQLVFGNLKLAAYENNLRISHTKDKFVFASKAGGMYVPRMDAIATSNKFGSIMFQTILSHEVAHFFDNKIGEHQGYRYSTDNFESISGMIADKFRDNMNQSSESKYINSTKECFARAFEQYFAIMTFGDDARQTWSYGLSDSLPYFDHPHYVSEKFFYDTMKPLFAIFFEKYDNFFLYNVVKDEVPEEVKAKLYTDKKKEAKKQTDKTDYFKEQIEAFKDLMELTEDKEQQAYFQEQIDGFEDLIELSL